MEKRPRQRARTGTTESANSTPRRAPDSTAEDTRPRPSRTSTRPRPAPRDPHVPPSTENEQFRAGTTSRGTIPRAVSAAVEWLKDHIHQTLDSAREVGAESRRTLDHWLDTLAESVTRGGTTASAALRAIDAALTGKNPVWAAIKELVSGLSRTTQIAVVLLIVLGLLLGPVLLVLALLALLVAGLAAAGRAATR